MANVDEWDDFEDEEFQDKSNQKIEFRATDLLKGSSDGVVKTADENLMKSKIRDLIDENVNKDVTKVLQFILEFADDKNAWRTLASCLKICPLEFARKGFNIIFDRFPFSGSFVKMYCEMEEAAKNYDVVIETLKKHIPYCVNIDLWVYCCNFFKRYLLEGKVGNQLLRARKEVEEVFSYAVDTVGFFVDSTDLWIAYLDFIRDKTTGDDSIGEYNLQRRKFYHRVVVIPLDWLEEAWTSYRVFEEGATPTRDVDEQKMIASKQMQIVDDKHNLAKEVLKERSIIWQYITDDNLPMHILTEESKNQVTCWIKYIKYEATNPMKLSREQLYHQLHMTYLRCLACCYYCPDIWLAFAQFEAKYDWKRAVNVLQCAMKAIPESIILRLACCDFYEEHDQLTYAEEEYEKIVSTVNEPVGWIEYMRYTRRQKGVQAYRDLFLRAKECCKKPEVFVTAALIERNVNRDENAGLNIFKLGMRDFSDNLYFVLQFADYLISLNQIDLAMDLLRQSLNKVNENDRSEIWDKLVKIQAQYKILDPIQKTLSLQKEYYDSIPSDRNKAVVEDVARYTIWGCSLQSPVDKSMLKRKYPFKPKKEDAIPTKVFEVDISSLSTPTNETEGRRMELPKWLEDIKRLLPMAGQKNSRGNEVDKLVEILKEVTIPSEEKLQLV